MTTVDVLALSDLTPERGRFVRAGKCEIALFRSGDQVFALQDSCPHSGASLAGGRFDGRNVTCRAHGLRFDVATGCMAGSVVGLQARVYPVQIVAGRIHVTVDC
jgi:3-phenylpropionate/trans-cinnamate dioxygenase ferredoxin component